jgi:hypothetical protein
VADGRPMRPGGAGEAMSEVELERALRNLGSEIAYPTSSVDFAAVVGQRLRSEPPPGGRFRWLRPGRGPRVRTAFVLAAALLLLVAAIVAAAVLGLPGIRIVFTERPAGSVAESAPATASGSPSGSASSTVGSPAPLGGALALGQAVDPAAVDAEAGRHVLRPSALGAPASAWLETRYGVPIVSLVWPASATLPDTSVGGGTTVGLGAILTEIPATIDRDYLEKIVFGGGTVERVSVGGRPGFWLSGVPHEVVLDAPNGGTVPSTTRLVGSSLLWERDGLTMRLESALDRDHAIALAETLR